MNTIGVMAVIEAILAREPWQVGAPCGTADPEAFFPEKGASTADARRICQGCEVRVQCLEYALRNNEKYGLWGGLSERQRRELRRSA